MPTDASPELHVTFIDHYTPHATAGIYTVTTRQELYDAENERIDTGADALPEAVQRFEIRPLRFVLKQDSVHALFPAPDSAGQYGTVLPHITLTRAILPWERELTGTRVREHAPWLALLVFREGELPGDGAAMGETVTRTVAELIDPAEPATIGPALSGPSLTPEVLLSQCETIDVPADVFHAVAPLEEELYYLAHVRDVRAPRQREDGEVLTEGCYAVITANRFARVPGRFVAHLVSLEGYERHVAPSPPTGHEALRLCSLWSWSFQHDPDNTLDAGGLLKNLAEPGRTDPENLALRLALPGPDRDPDAVEAQVRERLRLGYTAVPFRTLSGEQTYAWYRGPFTPVTAPAVPDPGLAPGHTTADHALIYEKDNGLFDVSYATAWTLGRTLGLADPDYAGEITRARRELVNQAAVLRKIAVRPGRAGRSLDAARGLRPLQELAETAGSLADALAAPQPDEPPPAPRRAARLSTAQLLADEPAAARLRATAETHTGSMPGWLDRLSLLEGVPFAYLVPDHRMLPPESMRLFRVDTAWIQAMVAGAADVGLHTSQDLALDPQVRGAVGRGRSAPMPAAGLLVFSALVRAWPDFPVFAFTGPPEAETETAVLRRQRLSDEVLLMLFGDVPDRIELREPGQGIHFGIDEGDVVGLRSLGGDTPPGQPLEEWFPDDGSTVFTRYLRPRPDGQTPDVLRLRGADGFVPGLAGAFGESDLTPGQFALQLVNAPLLQELRPLPDGSR